MLVVKWYYFINELLGYHSRTARTGCKRTGAAAENVDGNQPVQFWYVFVIMSINAIGSYMSYMFLPTYT